MSVVRIKVVVLEDDVEMDALEIGYFDGQPYTIKIDTPDGLDRKVDRKAGEA